MTDIREPQASSSEKPPLVISLEQAQVIYRKLQIGRWIAWLSYAGLLVLFTLLNLLRDTGSVKFWLVQVIPLLIFIPGLIRNTHRTYSWLCFVVLIYFVAIIPILMGRGWWSDWFITLLTTSLFLSAMMTSRWLQYWNYYLATKDKPPVNT